MKNNQNEDNSYIEHEIESSGELTVKSTRTQNILMRIGAIVIAFIIWVYASSQNEIIDTREITDIPVTIKTDGAFTLLSDDDERVDVTVSGKLRDINKLTPDSFTAIADASSITDAGQHTVPIKISSPRSIEITTQSISSVTIDIDIITTIQKDVKVKLTGYTVSEPYELGEITTDTAKVKISGPQLLLNKIDCALCTVKCGNLTSSITCTAGIVPVDENGNAVSGRLTMSASDCMIKIPVYFKKVVPLKVKFRYGYCDESNSNISISPSSITIRGEESVVSTINEIPLAPIDETKLLTDNISREITLPEGVTNASGVSAAVVGVELYDVTDFVLELNAITYINPAVLNFTPLSESISITLRGQPNAPKYIDSERLSATVDLSSISEGAGEVSVPLNIVISAGAYSSTTYVLGEYTQKLMIG